MRAVPAIRAGGLAGAVTGDVGGEGEGEVAKFDFAGDGYAGSDGGIAVVDLRLCVEYVVEAAHGGGAALEDVGDPTESDHGPDEHIEVKEEREERTNGKLMAEYLMAAFPEKYQETETDESLERGHEHAPGTNELDVARDVFAVRLIK